MYKKITINVSLRYCVLIGLKEIFHVVKADIIVNRLHSNLSSLFVVSHVLGTKVSPEWRLNLGFRTLEKLPGCQRLFAVDRPAAHTKHPAGRENKTCGTR